jgi:hypothetical protein
MASVMFGSLLIAAWAFFGLTRPPRGEYSIS